jgi:hypothetical protein
MVSPQQGLKGFAGAIGFFFGALLLSALVGAATAATQRSDGLLAQPSSDACTFACDTSGDTAGGNSVLQNNTGTNNTGFGDSTLSHNTTGTYDSAFGSNALFSNTTGFGNTASGAFALEANTSGTHDTADGAFALFKNTTGNENSAFGKAALFNNTTGNYNTASGFEALVSNTTGNTNTASGGFALFSNTKGGANTASGFEALFANTTGFNNTASGLFALAANTTGNNNTASGEDALGSTTGSDNTASGNDALLFNTTGSTNTASGYEALLFNTMGSDNTAIGAGALANNDNGATNNDTGNDNIGLGVGAGTNILRGSNNIEIWVAPNGPPISDESNTIRIGLQGTQKKTFIAGISGTPVPGADVTVDGNGQLGVLPSSARYKRDIRDMGGASAGLMKLRPVSFRYKSDPSGTLQYGLVADEVARVYPELVVHGTDGKVQSVRYLELTALLLNELQKQTTKIAAQQREIDALKQKDASINVLSERLAALEQQVRTAAPQSLRSLASK